MLDDDGTKAIRRQAPGKHDSSVAVTCAELTHPVHVTSLVLFKIHHFLYRYQIYCNLKSQSSQKNVGRLFD